MSIEQARLVVEKGIALSENPDQIPNRSEFIEWLVAGTADYIRSLEEARRLFVEQNGREPVLFSFSGGNVRGTLDLTQFILLHQQVGSLDDIKLFEKLLENNGIRDNN